MNWLTAIFTANATNGTFSSLTMMGGLLTFASMMANAVWGTGTMTVGEVATLNETIASLATNISAALGIVMVWWGRARATKQLDGDPLQ